MNAPTLIRVIVAACASFAVQTAQAQLSCSVLKFNTSGTGGGGDTASRLIAPVVGAALGVPAITENNSTASLAMKVANAEPDGCTIMMWGGALWKNPVLRKVPWNMSMFKPVVAINTAPSLLAVNPQMGVKTVQELILKIKSSPGKFNYAGTSPGASASIAGFYFKLLSHAPFVHVPYKNTPESIPDLVSGRAHFTIGPVTSLVTEARAGRLVIIAQAGEERSSFFPDLPTIHETLPGFSAESIFGAFLPAKTPDAIARTLNAEINKALKDPAVTKPLVNLGYDILGGTPERLRRLVDADVDIVRKVIEATKLDEQYKQ